MTAACLWRGIAAYLTAALVALAVRPPMLDMPGAARDVAFGAVAGLLLYGGVARVRPSRPTSVPLSLLLVVSASSEEVVWRYLVLGFLAGRAAMPVAIAASAALFACAHHRGRQTHLATGAVFGAVFAYGGGLAAACAAHAAYNLAVAGAPHLSAERPERSG